MAWTLVPNDRILPGDFAVNPNVIIQTWDDFKEAPSDNMEAAARILLEARDDDPRRYMGVSRLTNWDYQDIQQKARS